MKTCVMCANPVGRSQVVGIGHEDLNTNTGPMVAHSVCEACFLDPMHRLRNLKVHFMSLAASKQAIDASNRLDTLSKEGKDLAL